MNRIAIPGGWEFDPTTEFIYRNGVIIPGSSFEPIYLNSPGGPEFTGIYLKDTDEILLMSGRVVMNKKSEYIDV